MGTLVVFLFLFYVALPLLASHRAEVNSLAHINLGYLALGVLLEIGALVAYTQLTHDVLPDNGPRRLRLFRINMSTLALSHVSPGGTAPGAALGYRLLTQSGVSGSDAGFALGTQGIGSAVVLNVMFWCSLVAFLVTHGFHVPSAHHGHQSQSASILVIVAAGVGVVLLGAFGGLFYLLTRGQQRASQVIRRVAGRIRFLDADRTTALVERLAARFAVLMEDRSLTRRAVGWAAANWLLDAASLWVFVAAFSHFISPVDLLMAYGLANILAAIPITPGGLGVVEFVLVSMITGFGPTAGQALSAVLAYRAVNFWLPIPFGGLAYASLEFERRSSFRRIHQFVRHRINRRPGSGRRRVPAGSGAPPPGSATPRIPLPPPGGRRPHRGRSPVLPRRWRPGPVRRSRLGYRCRLRRPASGCHQRRVTARPPPCEGLRSELILQADAQTVGRQIGGHPGPFTVGAELHRVGLIEERPVEDPGHPALQAGLVDGHHHLHPAIQVALHQVGGAHRHADRPPGRAPEAEHPRVLEVPTHDGADPDAVRQPGHTGSQADTSRTTRSTDTPACEARYSASMSTGSVRPLVLSTMRPSAPARRSVSMASSRPDLVDSGETSRQRKFGGCPDPDNRLNSSPTSAPMSGSAVNRPRSS